MPPLGYDVVERKLTSNPAETQVVREMFSRFAAVPSMATLVRDLRARGVTSKCWTTAKGVERKGKLIDKGCVYKIFKNAVYIGIAAYKGQHYPGEHQGIISQELWDQVQEHLQNGDRKQKGPRADRASRAPSLLRGLLFSEQNRAFTPAYTHKGLKFYRYYVSVRPVPFLT